MDKELKGAISNWSFYDGRIHGICAWHTTCERGIAVGEPITTSPVVTIAVQHGARIAQTKNSFYFLV